jgi:hypothetical protein
MLPTNMNVSRTPMSAWSSSGDHAQVSTAAARVTPTRATTFPVKRSDLAYAADRGSPARWCASWMERRYSA